MNTIASDGRALRTGGSRLGLGSRFCAVIVALVVTSAVGLDVARAQDNARPPQSQSRTKPVAATKDDLTRRLELMLRTMRVARDVHVNRPEKPELIRGAIEGLLAALDPEAEIYTPAELRQFATPRGEADVGLELRREAPGRRRERPGYRVVSVSDGSSAAEAGLKAGDLITGIDGTASGPLARLDVARKRLPGQVGTTVRLRVERAAGEREEDIVLVRRLPTRGDVTARQLGAGVAYVRLGQLGSGSAEALAREVGRLVEVSGPIGSVVLDLRTAAGGSLGDADAVADAVLERGSLGHSKSRQGRGTTRAEARPGDALSGKPLAVLIDGGTAGALESLAAVLKDNGRARLVGTRSAGRGAVRELVPLGADGEKGSLRLATSQLLAPTGQPIEGKGVVPDVVVEQKSGEGDCRSLDHRDNARGICVLRPTELDAQLQRALELLAESRAVADDGSGLLRRP